MKRFRITRPGPLAVFIALMFLPVWASSVSAATGLDRMAGQIEGLFPDLKGFVLSVEGGQVLIDLKQGQPLKPGDVLNVVRLGETLTHPVTGEVVGRKETDVGTVEVVEVRDNYSITRVLSTRQPIQSGDAVRNRFRTMKLLVAPVLLPENSSFDPQEVTLSIERTLNERPRIEVPPFGLQAWMLENNLTLADLIQPETLARLDQAIDFDFLLVSKLETVKGQTLLRYRVISVEDGRPLLDSRVVIAEDTALTVPKPQEGVQTDLGKKPAVQDLVRFTARQEFDFELVDFDVGDLNGDGQPEFVFIDPYRILIYHYVNGRYDKIGTIKVQKEFNKFLSVDVADINGNGRAEIFVTNQSGKELNSFILEQPAGQTRFEKIASGLKRYFRVIRSYNGIPKLLTQHPGFEKPFKPGIFVMHYKNGEYVEGDRLNIDRFLNQQITLYGLAQEDTTFDKSIENIVLDNNYNLRVYSSDGKLLVKSDEYYGHDPRRIDVGLREQPYVDLTDPYIPQAVHYKGRLTLVEHRDRRFLLVPKNHRMGGSWLSNLVIINSGSLVFLAVNKEGLEKVFETQKQKGYLAAYRVVNTGASRKQVHVAMVSDKGGLFKDEKMTTLFVYEWE